MHPITEETADLLIINTCGVKSNTEQKILIYIEQIGKNRRNAIITGCLPFISGTILEKIKTLVPKFIGIIHPHNISYIDDIIRGFNQNHIIGTVIDNSFSPKLNKSKIFIKNQDSPIGILQISEGCIGNCSFCATKNARGVFHPFPLEDLKKQLDIFFNNNKKEIWLTSQDCGIGISETCDFFDLCEYISNRPENVFVRIGMINPEQIRKGIDRFLQIFESKKFYQFLHIPIQSANDQVLKKMNRKYRNEDIEYIFSRIRERDPKFSIATDVITGFPGENEAAFEETMDFLKKFSPDIINISKFSNRPGTLAKTFTPIDSKIVKERSKKVTELVNKISTIRNKMWVGWEGLVLIDEKGKKRTFMGRNSYYKCIVLKEGSIGNMNLVKIIAAEKNFCLGTLIHNK